MNIKMLKSVLETCVSHAKIQRRVVFLGALLGALTLSGCNSEGAFSAKTPTPPTPPKTQATPPGSLSLSKLVVSGENRTFGAGDADTPVVFSWNSSEGANGYTVCRFDNSLQNNCDPIGKTTETMLKTPLLSGPLKARKSKYFVLATNDNGVTPSNEQELTPIQLKDLVTSIKDLDNEKHHDRYGRSVSLSKDGLTLAVGSPTTNYSGDDKITNAGAVFIYRLKEGSWAKEEKLEPDQPSIDDRFGYSVSLSEDANTLAVGAPHADNSGAVYVYHYNESEGLWKLKGAKIKALEANLGKGFGLSVSLSADGNTLAVGHPDANASVHTGGVAFVYRYTDAAWDNGTLIKGEYVEKYNRFGLRVALSADGHTLVVAARHDNKDALNSGAVYLFSTSDTEVSWKQEYYIKAPNPRKGDNFGSSISLSDDGNTLAVGAPVTDTKINDDTTLLSTGTVYVYRYKDGNLSEPNTINKSFGNIPDDLKDSSTGHDAFGWSVSLSSDGNTLAVGAPGQDSGEIAFNGNEADDNNDERNSGAVYILSFEDGEWEQEKNGYIKGTEPLKDDWFGWSVSLSEDGNSLAVGAPSWRGGTKDNSPNLKPGRVYIY
ncbi:hypothetical protein [Grimontia sp. SpTr1]|uniref:hypothetical protein n=1 Tax=Grimontia sp. SpTr1 TaxID=2995319 RepID=UPI00248BC016|nr:hypothetical protein [Grimontia sp. SpTr1]